MRQVIRAKITLTLPPVILLTAIFSVVLGLATGARLDQVFQLVVLVIWLGLGFVSIGVAAGAIDPHFEAFAALCEQHGIAMTIVSDGPDRSIELLLRKAGLEIPYFANKLEWLGGRRWQLAFPNARADCMMVAGNCKCQFTDRFPAAMQIMVGDGRSDYCISRRVDLVLAKGALAKHCKVNDLAHFAIKDFRDAARLMQGWLAGGVMLSDGRFVEIGTAAA